MPAPPTRALRVAATALGGAVLALGVGALSLAAWAGWSWAELVESFVLSNAVIGLSFGGCGAVVAWARPTNPIGWLFGLGGLLQALSALMPALGDATGVAPDSVAARLVVTVFVYSWPWAIGLFYPWGLLLFPDGRLPSPRWRWVAVPVLLTGPLFVAEMGASPDRVYDRAPVAWGTLELYDAWTLLWQFAEWRTGAAYALALVVLVVRYRRGSETTRRQLLWLVLALDVALVAMVVWGQVAGAPVLVLLAIPLIPVAIAVAMVRHRLFDIRFVVSRAVAWLLLSLAVVVGYVALVALLDRVMADRLGRSTLATVVLVLAAAPLLPRLQRLVDRVFYGSRGDPAQAVSRLGERLATAETGLLGVVESVQEALRVPWAGLVVGDRTLAETGSPPSRVHTEPLVCGGEPVGALRVGLRGGERRLASADRRVLRLLAVPLAVAVHATLVSEELQASREHLVGAREEERRRLRRELHDGLGPTLTGLAFAADAAANLVAGGESPDGLLQDLRRDARAALADVRRVVDDLRPPALDQLGLAGAIVQRAEQTRRRADGEPVLVSVDIPDDLPPLPAAVEVAAYRIANEALTNIARHSRADRAVVRLRCADRLEVAIDDDDPAAGPWRPGVGLMAMRERTQELGGSFRAGPSAAGGSVRALLPLVAP